MKNRIDVNHLMEHIAKDHPNSFRIFYDLYYTQVFKYSYLFLNDVSSSKEVVSNVFFSIWQSRKTISAVSDIESYLYIATRNEARRYLINNKKGNFTPLDDIGIELKEDDETSPEQRFIDKEIEDLLSEIIKGLPEKCREIFVLARIEEMKPKEIAALLNIKESTVRVQMKIAVGKIIEKLKKHFPNMTFSILLYFLFSCISFG